MPKKSYAQLALDLRAKYPDMTNGRDDDDIVNSYWKVLNEQHPDAAETVANNYELPGGSATGFLKGLVRGAIPFSDRLDALAPSAGEFNRPGAIDAMDVGDTIGNIGSFFIPALGIGSKAAKGANALWRGAEGAKEATALAKALEVGGRATIGGAQGLSDYVNESEDPSLAGSVLSTLGGATSFGAGAYVPKEGIKRFAVPLAVQLGAGGMGEGARGYDTGGVSGAINSGFKAVSPYENPVGFGIAAIGSKMASKFPQATSMLRDEIPPAARAAVQAAVTGGDTVTQQAAQAVQPPPTAPVVTQLPQEIQQILRTIDVPPMSAHEAGAARGARFGTQQKLDANRHLRNVNQALRENKTKAFDPQELYLRDPSTEEQFEVLSRGVGGTVLKDKTGKELLPEFSQELSERGIYSIREGENLLDLPQGGKYTGRFADKIANADVVVVGETKDAILYLDPANPTKIQSVPKRIAGEAEDFASRPDVLVDRAAKARAEKAAAEGKGAGIAARKAKRAAGPLKMRELQNQIDPNDLQALIDRIRQLAGDQELPF